MVERLPSLIRWLVWALPESVERFRDAVTLAALMTENGFGGVTFRRLGMGSVALHHGVRED